MTHVTKAVLGAALLIGAGQSALAQTAPAPAAAPVAALPPSTVVAPGIATANIEAIKANSNAFKIAEQSRAAQYKQIIDQAKARAAQIDAQLKPMVEKLQADSKGMTMEQINARPDLVAQAQQIKKTQDAGQEEVDRIMYPVALSQAYVSEQIDGKLGPAIGATMSKQQITLLLRPDAIMIATSKTYDISQAILTELNTQLPTVAIVPPANWEPREVREAKAQQAAAQGAAAPAAPNATPPATGKKPKGR